MANIMRDYFEQFLESRGFMGNGRIESLSLWTPSYPLDCDNVCHYLHDLDRNVPIGIMSDFDCDGLMAGLVDYLGLLLLGFTNVRICSRSSRDGYEFTKDDIDRLGDIRVMITSDVGTMCVDAVSYAKQKGIFVIVTDHHTGDLFSSTYGIADCFVNPMFDKMRVGPASPNGGCAYQGYPICGAFVSYLIFERYFKLYPEEYNSMILGDLFLIRHFAGIATVSDRMPMLGQNRSIVQSMLDFYSYINPCMESSLVNGVANHPVIQNVYTNMHRFIDTIRGESRLGVNLEFVEFSLIPVINSIKRMGERTDVFYTMLFSDASQSEQCAAFLKDLNSRRKELVKSVFEQVLSEYESGMSEFRHIFLIPNDIPLGICGLVAQKMCDAIGSPVCIFQSHNGEYVGSARSFMDWHLLSEVNNSGFAICRGHEVSCGIFCNSSAFLILLDQFLDESFEKYAQKIQVSGDTRFDVIMDYDSDFRFDFHRKLRRFVRRCEKMGPFGNGFSAPLVLMKVGISNGSYTGMGANGCAHTKINLGRGLLCMLWNVDLSDIHDASEDGFLYLSGTMSYTRSAEGGFISFSCTPVPENGKELFDKLSDGRRVSVPDISFSYDMDEDAN